MYEQCSLVEWISLKHYREIPTVHYVAEVTIIWSSRWRGWARLPYTFANQMQGWCSLQYKEPSLSPCGNIFPAGSTCANFSCSWPNLLPYFISRALSDSL